VLAGDPGQHPFGVANAKKTEFDQFKKTEFDQLKFGQTQIIFKALKDFSADPV
jgi:hypothetical protein